MALTLHVYEDVPVSSVSFDAETQNWSLAPRQMLVDWLSVFERAVRVLVPRFSAPELPDPVSYRCDTVSSDGPYGASENFYYISWCSIELPGLRVHFESGRHEGGEPLCMETVGLSHNFSSYVDPTRQIASKARFFFWCEPVQDAEIRHALGLL